MPGAGPSTAGSCRCSSSSPRTTQPDTLLKLNAATWTLAVEVAFYLLLPVIGLLALRLLRRQRPRGRSRLLGSLVMAGLAWNLVDYALGWGPVASHSPPSFLPYFACGMLVALAVEARRARGAAPLGTPRRRSLLAGAARAAAGRERPLARASTARRTSFAMEVFADLGAAVGFAAADRGAR